MTYGYCPTNAEIESIKENARELLALIDECNLVMDGYFLEVLKKLSENPARGDGE